MTPRARPVPAKAKEKPADQGTLGVGPWSRGSVLRRVGLSFVQVILLTRAGRLRPLPKDLLARFVKLQDASDSAIHRFAVRWGLLGLCEHGWPASHKSSCGAADSEPTEAWRTWASGAHLLWKTGSDVASGRGITDHATPRSSWPTFTNELAAKSSV